MIRKTLVLPAALAGLLAAPLLAGCGSSVGDAGRGGAITVGTTDQFSATRSTPAPFDPAASYEIGDWNVLRNTFQTLLRLPRSGDRPVGDAARSCRFTDSAEQHYSCTLRPGLTFANGHRLDAGDVAFSIRRTLRIHDPNGPSALLSGVDRVTAHGDRVDFALKSPDATFPYKLATPAAAIVDSRVYPADRILPGFRTAGSGPYTLEVKNGGERAEFTANPHYRGGAKPRTAKVVLRSFANSGQMEHALDDGQVDLVNRSISPHQVTKLQAAGPDSHLRLVQQPGQEIRFLVFNTSDGPAGKQAVRRAVAQTVDRQALVRNVYARTADPLYSIVPTDLPGHRNSFFNRYGDPDRRAAARTLAAAGIHTPVKLTLTYTSDHYGEISAKEFAELKRQLNATGLFDVRIKGVPWATYRPAAEKGRYQVYEYGWYPDFPDADNFLAPFFDRGNILGSSWTSQDIRNRIIPGTRREKNRAATAGAFGRAQDIVADQVPLLPLWQGEEYVAARDDITGTAYALNSSSGLQLWELGRGAGS